MAVVILPSTRTRGGGEEGPLRIAFDGDAVLFSDEAERIYKSQGLTAFDENETRAAREPLPEGLFKPFLAALQRMQALHPPPEPTPPALPWSRPVEPQPTNG